MTKRWEADDRPMEYARAREATLRQFERAYAQRLLSRHRGNLTTAAKAAGMDRKSFWRVCARAGLRAETFRRAYADLERTQQALVECAVLAGQRGLVGDPETKGHLARLRKAFVDAVARADALGGRAEAPDDLAAAEAARDRALTAWRERGRVLIAHPRLAEDPAVKARMSELEQEVVYWEERVQLLRRPQQAEESPQIPWGRKGDEPVAVP